MHKRFGVIGNPIKHSLSPLMHNAVFKELNLDYDYKAIGVETDELEDRFIEFRREMSGINVTIPHKVKVMDYLDEVSKEARLIGAVNTVKFEKKAVGFNTDGIGCIKAFEEAGVRLEGKKILIIGAGGAARAMSFHLAEKKTEIWISDKIVKKAADLAMEVNEKVKGKVHATILDEETLAGLMKDVDVLINATPVGMSPNVNEIPINANLLKKGLVVMDIVYNPMETKLLKEAKKKGCETMNGVGMFVNQGAEALRIWLEIKPPVELMRETVVKALGGSK